jgi:hypothetical protein
LLFIGALQENDLRKQIILFSITPFPFNKFTDMKVSLMSYTARIPSLPSLSFLIFVYEKNLISHQQFQKDIFKLKQIFTMKKITQLFSSVLFVIIVTAQIHAQVKIGDNANTINANSLLELESTNKGILPPRVIINDLNAVAPLTGTVPTGMLVFSSGGSVADGYYYWDSSKWVPFINLGEVSITNKNANATLTKTETFVVASNDITLTLPAITAADNGLSITIKNIGTYTDEIDVAPNGSCTIDGLAAVSKHFRWVGKTYVASGGNWVIKGNRTTSENVFEVSENGSWTSIPEVLEFLSVHMTGPSVVRLMGGDYEIPSTQEINLDYPLTIQGSSYGAATIIPANGLSGSAMFSCLTETYFKMLAFDASALSGYGSSSGEDAIQLATGGEYFEIKDCSFDGFNRAIAALSNVEVWIFEVDVTDAQAAGIELATGGTSGVSLKISETDFIRCAKGINFKSGVDPVISVLNCGFYNSSGQIGINYVPATFTSLNNMFITNNTWNNIGTFMSGFDFSRSDSRDANTFIRNNSGGQDKNPHCRINVNNNASTTTISSAGTWYKAAWTNTASITTKWTINNNRITYQPVNKSDGWAIITGNISVNSNNRTISIGIIKNGVTTTRYGESDLRLTTAGDPYQFSTVIYLTDIGPGDYFELYCTSANSGDIITFRDIQWFTETK